MGVISKGGIRGENKRPGRACQHCEKGQCKPLALGSLALSQNFFNIRTFKKTKTILDMRYVTRWGQGAALSVD